MTDHSDLIAELGQRWEATDAPVAKKINRLLRLAKQAASALSSQSLSLSEAREALEQCETYFDNRADADCEGDPAEFVPNKEMVLLSVVRDAMAKIGGRRD